METHAPRSLRSSQPPATRTEDELIAAALQQEQPPPVADSAPAPAPGRIGCYRILRPIGAGGMGVVYEAEQEAPVRRRVALKVIKLGMDTREVVTRFEAERQALALMDHPGIARVFDAGATEEGRPYFVMEYIPGTRITEYCDQQRLTVSERVELFIQVCHAIQHAHQKGVIHRDIKPSNVLVSALDGRPLPKVIDFGVAKAVDQRLSAHTILTGQDQHVGTPAYMSPEQAGLSALDIDTRSDIYSLGVLLYELLVGALPYGATRLRGRTFGEIQRVICQEEPARLASRLDALGPALDAVAARRRCEPGALRRHLRGDLNWITLRALEKDRNRRYASASDLAADLQRYLRHEPVLAGPPTAAYRLRKFVRRNRGVVLGAAAVVTVLVAGIVVSTGLAIGQARAKREAQQRAYFANIAAARAALTGCDTPQMRRALEAAPAALRNWEWRYLEAQSDRSWRKLEGHADEVWCVAFSPDGRRLASAGGAELSDARADNAVRIWDLDTGSQLAELRGHTGTVYSVAFSPDGRHLATAGHEGTVRIWDSQRQWEPMVLELPRKPIYCVAFSPDPDGEVLACAHRDVVRVLCSKTGGELRVLRQAGTIYALAFSPDGGRLASVGQDREVHLWNTATGEELAALAGHTHFVRGVAFSPSRDGVLATASFDQTVRLWDASGRLRHILRGHAGRVQAVAFSADGAWLASAADDATVRLWNPEDGNEVAVLMGHTKFVRSVAFSPDGKTLATASADRSVRIWRIRDHVPDSAPQPPDAPRCVAFSRDGRCAAVARGQRAALVADPAGTGAEAVRFEHGSQVTGVALSPDGRWLASCSSDGTARIWDTNDGRQVAALSGHESLVNAVAFSPDGAHVASASEDRTVRIWDPLTGREVRILRGHSDAVHSVVFSPDGRRLASASTDHSVRIWDASTGQALATLAHGEPVSCVVFSPNREWLVSASSSGQESNSTVRVWSARTYQQQRGLGGQQGAIYSVAFSPDGTRLASGGWDTTVRLWDPRSGEELLTLRGHGDQVNCVAFSPDGQRLLSVARDGTLRTWDTQRLGPPAPAPPGP